MFTFAHPSIDIAHLLDTGVLILSFILLAERRLFSVLRTYSFQALTLATAAAWQGYIQDAPHLYLTAVIALVVKAIIIPTVMHRLIVHFKIHRSVDLVISMNITMIIAVALVALSIVLMLPVTMEAGTLTRESLAIALSVVLIGILMMITRRNAMTQVVGFLSLENGLILAAVGVKGMPMVVELFIAFLVMVAFILFGIFFFHIRERFDTLNIDYLDQVRQGRRE